MNVTDYLAIYGAFLSTAVLVWDVRRSTSKVHVEIINAVEVVECVSKHGIGISVKNPTNKVVHLANVSLLYEYKLLSLFNRVAYFFKFRRFSLNSGWCHAHLSNYAVNDKCPVSIEPGQSHWIFVSEDIVEEILKNGISRHLKAVVQDSLWRDRYSKKFEDWK